MEANDLITVADNREGKVKLLPPYTVINSRGLTVSTVELIRNAACQLLPCGAPSAALEAGVIVIQGMVAERPESVPYRYGQEYYSDILRAVEARFLLYTVPPEGKESIETYINEFIALARSGADYEQIIRRTLGTPVLEAEIQGCDGAVLAFGDRGETVRRLQNRLNRISMTCSAIPKLIPDGIFGARTEQAVRIFQRWRLIKEDAVAGKVTRTEIYLAYLLAQRLIKTAGEEYVGIEQMPAPASKGKDTVELQKLLKAVAVFYPSVYHYALLMQEESGYYGDATARCVWAVQGILNTVQNGVISAVEVGKLSRIYLSVKKLLPKPIDGDIALFDGSELYEGCKGERVYLASKYLSELSQVFGGIPEIETQEVFSPKLHRAVVQFQTLFCDCEPTGRIDAVTWERLAELCCDARAYKAGEVKI